MNTSSTTKLDSRGVQRAFKKYWAEYCKELPAYEDDRPAKRMAFTVFVDDLERNGNISEKVASNVTLENDK